MSKKRDQTRTQLLDTVLSLLMQPKGADFRMVDVAKAAGVTRQTVYDHFSNRSDMLVAAILHFGEKLDIDARLAPSRAAPSGRDRLTAYTKAMLEFFPAIYPLKHSLTHMGANDAEAMAAWNNRMDAMKQGCAAAIKALKADGDLAQGLTEAQATDLYFILLNMDGWAHCVLDNGWTDAEFADQIQRVTRMALTRA